MRDTLLALVMIVKDEAASIQRTIASVSDAVDYVFICDTGSTDDTVRLARAALEFNGVEGRVDEGVPFIDYAAARNEALDRLGEQTAFSLFLSGDEELVNAAALRTFCETQRTASDGAYNVRVALGSLRFDSARLARTAAHWRYVGAVHEVLIRSGDPPPSQRVPSAYIRHDISRRTPKKLQSTWLTHEKTLLQMVTNDPRDARAWFYLGQTLSCLADVPDAPRMPHVLRRHAANAYLQRAALGGWAEERFHALLGAASSLEESGEAWARVQDLYLQAAEIAPHRCEPWLRMAYHWRNRDAWATALPFAWAACARPYPETDVLFINTHAWNFERWELLAVVASWLPEHREVAVAAAERAVAAQPDNAEVKEQFKNLLPAILSVTVLDEKTRNDVFKVVILSKCADNLIACVRALQTMEPDLPADHIVVVDDGARAEAESQLPGLHWVEGEKPFVFARNANIGMRAAASNVVLLNDDAILETPGGLSAMVRAACAADLGLCATAVRGVVGNARQQAGTGTGLVHESECLMFVCVLVPQGVFEVVGSFDERFVGYGYEDNDYSDRVRAAGFKMGVYHDCVVEHGSILSTFRSRPDIEEIVHDNFYRYQEKRRGRGEAV